MNTSGASRTEFLDLPDGRLAYDDTGDGPLIVATPAMLDLRSELRFLVPLLVGAGFRVVTVDQRGMGESSGHWPAYGSEPLACDLIALIRHLDAAPAIIYGTSNGAAAGVNVAVQAPNLVRGLVLAGPFVRDGKSSWLQRRLMSVMKIPFLTLPIYMSYYPKWEPKQPRVADFDEHVAKLRANLSEASRRNVIRAYMFQQTHRGRGEVDRLQAWLGAPASRWSGPPPARRAPAGSSRGRGRFREPPVNGVCRDRDSGANKSLQTKNPELARASPEVVR
jgi:pimeloyl-ACP methyl ester carboxylesterase